MEKKEDNVRKIRRDVTPDGTSIELEFTMPDGKKITRFYFATIENDLGMADWHEITFKDGMPDGRIKPSNAVKLYLDIVNG